MAVPGMIFMLKNKHTVDNAIGEAGFESDKNPKMFAIAAYYLYLLGMVLFTLGMFFLATTLEVPPALGIAAVVGGPISILIWMPVMKMGITGIPGIMGPPMPARIALIVIGVVTNLNAFLHFFPNTEEPITWIKFFSIYAA